MQLSHTSFNPVWAHPLGMPRFAGETETPKPAEQPKRAEKPRKNLLQKTWSGVLRVAPFSNLLGGLMLISSAFLPQHAAVNPQVSAPAQTAQVQSAQSVQPARKTDMTQQLVAENGLADVRDLLIRLGWILGATGAMAGKINVIAAGHQKKQPSMVMGGLWGLGMATCLMFDPTVPVRIAFLTASAMLINGFGNMVQNEYRLKQGQKPREFDMRPLHSKQALKKLLGDNADPSSMQLLNAWVKELGKMGKFVVEDHVLMAGKVVKGMGYTVIHPMKTVGIIKDNTVQMGRYAKHGLKSEYQPDFIKPSDTQNQIGSMLIYAGGIPWLLLSGSLPGVEQACQALIAAGSLTADLSLVGVGGAEKGINKAVAFGPLLINGGIPWVNTNPGAGVGMVGNAFVDNYFANKAEDETEPPEQTAPAVSENKD